MKYIQAITNFLALTLLWIFVRYWLLKADQRTPTNVEATGHLSVKKMSSSQQTVVSPNSIVQRSLYWRLVRGLREKDETIEILNRKLAFLNGEIKLKDMRIANLVGQVSNFVQIGLQRTRPYVTGSKQPRLKTKMPSSYF